MTKVLAYYGTQNLGDAIQTVALTRLLAGEVSGIWRHAAHRDAASNEMRVINGWIGGTAPSHDSPTLFAGVYLGRNIPAMADWMRRSDFPLGARDPATVERLHTMGMASELVGCATLTLDRSTLSRAGVLAIDTQAPQEAKYLTQAIPPDMPWSDQWRRAVHRLEQLRRARIVYTSRLHVALPCLAFQTPVVVRRTDVARVEQPDRFSLLNSIGFRYDEPCMLDVHAWRERYMRFLRRVLPTTRRGPVFPAPTEAPR